MKNPTFIIHSIIIFIINIWKFTEYAKINIISTEKKTLLPLRRFFISTKFGKKNLCNYNNFFVEVLQNFCGRTLFSIYPPFGQITRINFNIYINKIHFY